MAKSVNYATRDYTVEPGATLQIVRQAQFVACLAASDTFKIAFDDGSESDFEAGLTYSPESGFSRILIRNPGATTLTVSLGIGAGNIRDGRVTINAGVTLPVRAASPDKLTTHPQQVFSGATLTKIASADPLRKELVIYNKAGSAIMLRKAGDTGATEGINIGVGERFIMEFSGDLYAQSVSTAMQYVVVTEIGWSA